jgi:hypothetical protein
MGRDPSGEPLQPEHAFEVARDAFARLSGWVRPPTAASWAVSWAVQPQSGSEPKARNVGSRPTIALVISIIRGPERSSAIFPNPLELLSGRQDLNLRPPGPQPEGWGRGGCRRPGFIGFLTSGVGSVLLSLIPVLIPEHVFARSGMPCAAYDGSYSPTRARYSRSLGRSAWRFDSWTSSSAATDTTMVVSAAGRSVARRSSSA